jgi:putative chitinase
MIIKKGSNGEAVKQIQRKLGLKDDGDFGQNTHNAVAAWQKANGLLDDGIVGAKTWALMFPLVLPDTPFKFANLRGHIPDSVLLMIPDTAKKFNITNNLRLAHFLAQCAHESGNFRVVYENLNYDAAGLRKVFPSYFPTVELAQQYAFKPELIASRTYGNRMGNGNEASREGFIFRGRGYIQLTGKNNYRAFDAFVDEDIMTNPDLVATKYPLMSAAWFFHVNAIWSVCDLGSNEGVVKQVTRLVNGGYNGLADRVKHFGIFFNLLNA